MSRKLYKVIHVARNGQRVSAFAEYQWQLVYEKDFETTAPVGKIFCFKSYDAALQFVSGYTDTSFEIWEVEAHSVQPARNWICKNFTGYDQYWEHVENKHRWFKRRSFDAPWGTVWAKSITLLNKVYPKEPENA